MRVLKIGYIWFLYGSNLQLPARHAPLSYNPITVHSLPSNRKLADVDFNVTTLTLHSMGQ